MDKSIIVQKASGDLQFYTPTKLESFLRQIEVPDNDIDNILKLVHVEIGQQTSTSKIAQLVTDHLRELPRGELYSARYNLKPALRKLGPGGHIFEEYVGRLFQHEGFEVQVGIQLRGKCVSHEVDVVLKKDNCLQMVEVKFHNREGIKSDVTVAMYTYARFLDIKDREYDGCGFTDVWLITNTKPSGDALTYAECQGMKVLTVELPYGNSIMDKVVKNDLFPVGTIDHLDMYLEQLYMHDIVLLKDVLELEEQRAKEIGVPLELLNESKAAARRILSPN